MSLRHLLLCNATSLRIDLSELDALATGANCEVIVVDDREARLRRLDRALDRLRGDRDSFRASIREFTRYAAKYQEKTRVDQVRERHERRTQLAGHAAIARRLAPARPLRLAGRTSAPRRARGGLPAAFSTYQGAF